MECELLPYNLFKSLDMAVILKKRIIELFLSFVEKLCPLFAALVSVNPSPVVLCLNDKYSRF
jgi:hypothetical protein